MYPLSLLESGKIKRYFRATKKLNTPGIISHITQRAAGKGKLFIEDKDYLIILRFFKEIARKYDLNVFCFCLMPNHVHLLISPQNENLYDAMRDLFSRYAMYFNRKYERKGHLFGGPYRQAVCFDDRYLLAASLYIHLNPVRASIVVDPTEYRWSSIDLYTAPDPPKSFVDPAFILDMLTGEKDDPNAGYRRLLKQGLKIDTGHILEHENAIERLGSKLATMFPVLFNQFEKTNKVFKSTGKEMLSFKMLEDQIAEMRNGPASQSPEQRKAKKYLIEQLLSRGFTRREIAHKIGISRKTVYNILKSSL